MILFASLSATRTLQAATTACGFHQAISGVADLWHRPGSCTPLESHPQQRTLVETFRLGPSRRATRRSPSASRPMHPGGPRRWCCRRSSARAARSNSQLTSITSTSSLLKNAFARRVLCAVLSPAFPPACSMATRLHPRQPPGQHTEAAEQLAGRAARREAAGGAGALVLVRLDLLLVLLVLEELAAPLLGRVLRAPAGLSGGAAPACRPARQAPVRCWAGARDSPQPQPCAWQNLPWAARRCGLPWRASDSQAPGKHTALMQPNTGRLSTCHLVARSAGAQTAGDTSAAQGKAHPLERMQVLRVLHGAAG